MLHVLFLKAFFCFTGIRHCEKFLDTLEVQGGSGTRYSDDLVRPAMVAMFRVGKFYNKIFTPIAEDQIKFTKIAMESYQAVVDYCQDNPDQKKTVAVELDHCVGTIDLLDRQLKMHARSLADTQAGADSQ